MQLNRNMLLYPKISMLSFIQFVLKENVMAQQERDLQNLVFPVGSNMTVERSLSSDHTYWGPKGEKEEPKRAFDSFNLRYVYILSSV